MTIRIRMIVQDSDHFNQWNLLQLYGSSSPFRVAFSRDLANFLDNFYYQDGESHFDVRWLQYFNGGLLVSSPRPLQAFGSGPRRRAGQGECHYGKEGARATNACGSATNNVRPHRHLGLSADDAHSDVRYEKHSRRHVKALRSGKRHGARIIFSLHSRRGGHQRERQDLSKCFHLPTSDCEVSSLLSPRNLLFFSPFLSLQFSLSNSPLLRVPFFLFPSLAFPLSPLHRSR